MAEQKDYISNSHEKGDIHISGEVLSMIAGTAALEVEGVCGLAGANLGGQLLGKRSPGRGVVVVREEDVVIVNLSLCIQYGMEIPELGRKVQEAVKCALESTCGLSVGEVNIRVAEVQFGEQ